MKILLITLLFNINLANDSTANYKDTITVEDRKLAVALKYLWLKHPLDSVKTPIIIYKPKNFK